MPASPEVSDRSGGIGIVKILRDMEAEPTCDADGHQRIASKVEIDLAGKGEGRADEGGV